MTARAAVYISGNDVSGRGQACAYTHLSHRPHPPPPWTHSGYARNTQRSRKMRCTTSSPASSMYFQLTETMTPEFIASTQQHIDRHSWTRRKAARPAVLAGFRRVVRSGTRGPEACQCGLEWQGRARRLGGGAHVASDPCEP